MTVKNKSIDGLKPEKICVQCRDSGYNRRGVYKGNGKFYPFMSQNNGNPAEIHGLCPECNDAHEREYPGGVAAVTV